MPWHVALFQVVEPPAWLASENVTVVDEVVPEALPVIVAVFPQILPEKVTPFAMALTEVPF